MTLLWDSDDAPDWEEGFQAIEEFDWSKPVLPDENKSAREDKTKEQTSIQSTGLLEPDGLRESFAVREPRVLNKQQQATRAVERAESGQIQQAYITSMIGKVKKTVSTPSSSARASIALQAAGSTNAPENTSGDIGLVDRDVEDMEAMDIEVLPVTVSQSHAPKERDSASNKLIKETRSFTTTESLQSERQPTAPISLHGMHKDDENAMKDFHTAAATVQPDIPMGLSQTRNDSIVGLDAYVLPQRKDQLDNDLFKKNIGNEPRQAQQGVSLENADWPQSDAKSALTGIESGNHVMADRPALSLEHGTASHEHNDAPNPQETAIHDVTSSIHKVALNDVEVPSLLKRSTIHAEKAIPVALEPDGMAIDSAETANLSGTTHKRNLHTMQKENSPKVDMHLPATKKAKTAQEVQVMPTATIGNKQAISGHGKDIEATETAMEDAGYASPDLIKADSNSNSDSNSESDEDVQQNKATVTVLKNSKQDQDVASSTQLPPSSLPHNLINTPSVPTPPQPHTSSNKTATTTQRRELILNENMSDEHLSDIEDAPVQPAKRSPPADKKKRSIPSVRIPAPNVRPSTPSPTNKLSTPPPANPVQSDISSNPHYRPKNSVSKRELQSLHASPPRERKRARRSYISFGDESDVSFTTEKDDLDGEVDVDRTSKRKKVVGGKSLEKMRHPLDPGYGKRHTRGDTKAAVAVAARSSRSSSSNGYFGRQQQDNNNDEEEQDYEDVDEEEQDYEDVDDDEQGDEDEDDGMLTSTEIAALEAHEDEADESYTPTPTPTSTATTTSTRPKSTRSRTTNATSTSASVNTKSKSKPESKTKPKRKRHSDIPAPTNPNPTRASRSRTSLPSLSSTKNKHGWTTGADSDVGSEQEKQRSVEPERRKTRRVAAQEEGDGNVKMRLRGKKGLE